MDLDTDDDILRELADGKSMDYEQWPALQSRLIVRLDKLVHGGFYAAAQTIPPSSQPPSSPRQPEAIPNGHISSQSSTQSADKENSPPNAHPANTHISKEILAFQASINKTFTRYFTQYPPHTIQRVAELFLTPNKDYKILSSYLHGLQRALHVTSGANKFPLPLAIPDAAALEFFTNGDYDPLAESISWGSSALGSDESLGGALLTPIYWLTKPGRGSMSPIPDSGSGGGEVKTESTEMVEGPNGLGGVETVSVSINGVSSATARDQNSPPLPASTSSATAEDDLSTTLRAEGGVTQGELLRQEQEAGVVPASQLAGSPIIDSSAGKGNPDGTGEADEIPHARGPEEIGMEDLGPQAAGSVIGLERGVSPGLDSQEIDVDATTERKTDVGASNPSEDDLKMEENRGVREETPKREADEEMGGMGKRVKSEDPDIELTDTTEVVEVETNDASMGDDDNDDKKTDNEPKAGEEVGNKEPDNADTGSV